MPMGSSSCQHVGIESYTIHALFSVTFNNFQMIKDNFSDLLKQSNYIFKYSVNTGPARELWRPVARNGTYT